MGNQPQRKAFLLHVLVFFYEVMEKIHICHLFRVSPYKKKHKKPKNPKQTKKPKQ